MFNKQIRAAFEQRIEKNYQAALDEWRQLSPDELIEKAEEIAAMKLIRGQISDSIVDETASYLLRFADPLSVVTDYWIEENGADMVHDEDIAHALWRLQDSGCAEQCYDLAPGFRPETEVMEPQMKME